MYAKLAYDQLIGLKPHETCTGLTDFDMPDKSQLIEYAFDSGLDSVIQETLLKKQISVVLHSDK